MSFWNTLKKPIMALAPMAEVTDAAFRHIIAKYGKPDVMFTEFTSVAGLCSPGREKLLVDFWYTEKQRPIVAQIFGCNPAQFYEVAQLIQELDFDGIDINMGCPDRSVEKQGGGAALIKHPDLAQEIIKETKRGAGNLPVSVKTRLGYSTTDLTWIRALLEAEPAALIVHLRTRKEMSKVPAHWDAMPDIVALAAEVSFRPLGGTRDKLRPGSRTLILGNGDVQTINEAHEKGVRYGCDGVMIGRGIFGNPWLFSGRQGQGILSSLRPDSARFGQDTLTPPLKATVSLEEKFRVMLEHTYLFEKLFSGIKNFDIMKKHYKAYVSGFDGAKELRIKLMKCKTADEVARIIKSVIPAGESLSRTRSGTGVYPEYPRGPGMTKLSDSLYYPYEI